MSRTESYSLILTHGVHIISPGAAETICQAIENDVKVVEIELQLFPGSDSVRRTKVVTAHVVALAEAQQPQPLPIHDHVNVSVLRNRR